MKEAVIAVRDKNRFATLEQALLETGFHVTWAHSVQEAFAPFSDSGTPVALFISDESLEDLSAFQLTEKIVMQSPMTNCAAVSTLSHKDFHEAFEGLGLFMQLSPKPDQAQAGELITVLKKITGMTG